MSAKNTSTEPTGVDLVETTTTKGHADNTYEHLVACHDLLNSIGTHLYSDDDYQSDQPCQPGLHGTIKDCDRLANELQERISRIWNRL